MALSTCVAVLYRVAFMSRAAKRSSAEAIRTKDASLPLPRWIPPQLCQPVETAPSGAQWLHGEARQAVDHARNEVEAVEIVHHACVERRRGRAMENHQAGRMTLPRRAGAATECPGAITGRSAGHTSTNISQNPTSAAANRRLERV